MIRGQKFSKNSANTHTRSSNLRPAELRRCTESCPGADFPSPTYLRPNGSQKAAALGPKRPIIASGLQGRHGQGFHGQGL